MAPTATAVPDVPDVIADLKAKVVNGHVEVEQTPKPPIADNYMYDFKYNHALPTIDALGLDIPADVDAEKQAQALTTRLAEVLGSGDAQGFTDMFLDYGE
jgi:hypothetical protein